MQLSKSKLRQVFSYLAIGVVTLLSIFLYATGDWKKDIIIVGFGLLILIIFAFFVLWDDSEE